MADEKTTIRDMIDCVADFEKRRDWQQFHDPKNLSMGLAIEAAELMEHFLWVDPRQAVQVRQNQEELARVQDEMADVLNYLLMMTHILKIDLSEAFFDKMKRNEEKYPADLYRGKYKL